MDVEHTPAPARTDLPAGPTPAPDPGPVGQRRRPAVLVVVLAVVLVVVVVAVLVAVLVAGGASLLSGALG